jgi:hypothetical protein
MAFLPGGRLSAEQHGALARAFDFFNERLFESTLPAAMITLHRHRGARGYFRPEAFKARHGEDVIHEIALCPETFEGRSTAEILSTLVHEMVHHWQECFGKKKVRRCYHNREWADKMFRVGLHPSTTGAPGGKETGQRCSHYIIAGGVFERACDELLASGQIVDWNALTVPAVSRPKSKVKFTCPCGTNAWAKPKTELACVKCGGVLVAEEDP